MVDDKIAEPVFQNGLCGCFRVGQADAERRQDIVLSGAHIKEEHCIFRSERNANGDGGISLNYFSSQFFNAYDDLLWCQM